MNYKVGDIVKIIKVGSKTKNGDFHIHKDWDKYLEYKMIGKFGRIREIWTNKSPVLYLIRFSSLKSIPDLFCVEECFVKNNYDKESL